MALNIKNKETERLARTLAKRTGESITEAVTVSLADRLKRQQVQQQSTGLAAKIMEISRRCSALPVLDNRSADEIIGYDEHGLPS